MYELVAQFMEETNTDVDTAWTHLLDAGWKFQLALEAFYNTEPQGSELTDMEDLESDMEDLEGEMEAAEISDEMTDLESEEEAGEMEDRGTVTDNKTVSTSYQNSKLLTNSQCRHGKRPLQRRIHTLIGSQWRRERGSKPLSSRSPS